MSRSFRPLLALLAQLVGKFSDRATFRPRSSLKGPTSATFPKEAFLKPCAKVTEHRRRLPFDADSS